MSGNSSRKTSASRPHSPPTNVQSQRIMSASQSLNVGMTGSSGLKGLNSGWQVWSGAGSPSSQRKPLSSPASAGLELLPESGFRMNTLPEPWSASTRPSSGSWDEGDTNLHKPDILQLPEPQSQLNLRQLPVQNAAFSGPRIDDRISKSVAFSPRVVDTRFQISTHSYAANASIPSADDLSLSIRGMTVEDDFNVRPTQRVFNPLARLLPPVSQPPPRPYGPYGQEYSPYYNPPGSEYPYGYEVYRPPPNASLFVQPSSTSVGGSNMNIIPPQQPGLYFDARPPGSQFFFPSPQAMLYPPTPIVNPQLPGHIPPDKKPDSLYNLQPSQPNLMYGGVQPPLPQPYNPPLAAIVIPGAAMYGPGPQGMPMYPPMIPPAGRPEAIDISSVAVRSRLLEDFRTNRSKKWELRDVWGHVAEFSRDQHGSRFIQQKIEIATPEERQKLFEEIIPTNALLLIQDVFGNYVIQKLLEHGSQMQKNILMATMEGHILPFSLQMYGCRVVQKALEHVSLEQQGAIVRELEPHVLLCVKDSNGNHVIQKIIERVSAERLNFIDAFRSHVLELGTHPYGCRVLQRCFEYLPEEHSRPLLDEVNVHSISLMQDQFGNYVMQYLIEHGKPQDRALLISKMRSHLTQLSRHKFASNVCEKALVFSDPETRYTLIDLLLKPKESNASSLTSMMKDQYANYVLQRALTVVEGEQKEALFNKVRSQLTGMRKFGSAYSKHLSAIEKIIERYSSHNTK